MFSTSTSWHCIALDGIKGFMFDVKFRGTIRNFHLYQVPLLSLMESLSAWYASNRMFLWQKKLVFKLWKRKEEEATFLRSIFINTLLTLLIFVNISLVYSWKTTCCMKHGSKACARWMHVVNRACCDCSPTLCWVPTSSCCLGKIFDLISQ